MIITKTMNNLNRKDSFIITLYFEHLIEVKIRDRHVLRKKCLIQTSLNSKLRQRLQLQIEILHSFFNQKISDKPGTVQV
jgi:hypothetical protein